MRIVMVDTGIGNIHSLAKALDRTGARVTVSTEPRAALSADAVVLPGVGAFSAAAERLSDSVADLREAIRDGLPCLGICLGMQLLFEASDEGPGAGLGLLAGRIRPLVGRRVPNIGWSTVSAGASDPVLGGLDGAAVYFAHSYVAAPERPDVVVARGMHDGVPFPAAVRQSRCWGVQFHPEKSGAPGLRLLEAWVEEAGR